MNDHFAITSAASNNTDPSWIFREHVNAIDVSLECTDKRLGEHAVHLGGVDGAGVFAGTRERVQRGIQIALNRMR